MTRTYKAFLKGCALFLVTALLIFSFCACSQEEKEVGLNLSKSINLVTSGPGEDASTSAVISWHAKYLNSVLEYKKAGDSQYTVMNVKGVQSTSNWTDNVSFYRCRVELSDLTPDTDYTYRVKSSDGTVSSEAKFRTAGTDKTFSFLWLSDLHVPKGSTTDMNKIKALVNYANAKDGIDVDFCLFTGDMVNKGQNYKHWNYWADSGVLNAMEYAFLPGNHDYYPNDSSKTRYSNCYFLDVAAHPYNNVCNGKSVTKSDYWFLWNDVLFINIDSMAPEATKVSETVAKQKAWFEEVVKLNAGKYTYLVVSQHYAYILNKEETWGEYESWYPLFDQYKVDFALGSDSHEYARSKPLVNNQPQEGGTIYLSSSMTQGSLSVIDPILDLDSRCAFYGGGVSGGCYFTVTPEKMVMHLIGYNGNEYDSVEVSPKSR